MVQRDAFHIVGHDIWGHPRILKCIDHINKQFFRLVLWKHNAALSAVVTDHSEACCLESVFVVVQHICEAPVHLVVLDRLCGSGITASTFPCGETSYYWVVIRCLWAATYHLTVLQVPKNPISSSRSRQTAKLLMPFLNSPSYTVRLYLCQEREILENTLRQALHWYFTSEAHPLQLPAYQGNCLQPCVFPF